VSVLSLVERVHSCANCEDWDCDEKSHEKGFKRLISLTSGYSAGADTHWRPAPKGAFVAPAPPAWSLARGRPHFPAHPDIVKDVTLMDFFPLTLLTTKWPDLEVRLQKALGDVLPQVSKMICVLKMR
jgi:hypothetical protein